jgi:hypothetical protein
MEETTAVVPGYEVGKKKHGVTFQYLVALVAYAAAVMFIGLPALAYATPPVTAVAGTNEAFITGGVIALAIGIWASISHLRSPLRKYTIMRSTRNTSGSHSIDVLFMDGTSSTLALGADSFGAQLTRQVKSMLNWK